VRGKDARLDTIARGLASGMSRREALRAGGAALIGAAAMTPVDAWAAVTGHCPHGHVKCHGACCPKGEVCLAPKHKGGKHRCGCPDHTSRCSGKCVHLRADPHNCGHCGHKCGAGEHCVNGTCGCPSGMTACSGACVTLASDTHNCGACGSACPPGQVCSSGQCAVQCPSGKTACSGGCVDVSSDTSNCGSCGHTCATGASCANGTCTCPAGEGVCNGACVNQMTNTATCGANCVDCNNLPFVSGPFCSNGSCDYATCAGPWANCSGNRADGCPCLVQQGVPNPCNPDGTCKMT
jgi:Stigma-specific protein, Stig1